MEVPRPGVASELQLPAYATATATPDLSLVCHPHRSSRQHWILNPLSKAGVEPANSWFLVGFVSAAPRQELLCLIFEQPSYCFPKQLHYFTFPVTADLHVLSISAAEQKDPVVTINARI